MATAVAAVASVVAGAVTSVAGTGAVASVAAAAAGTIAGAATGAVIGGVVGGVISGTVSELTGGSFSDGFKKGLVTGAIAGGVLSVGSALGAATEAVDAASTAADIGSQAKTGLDAATSLDTPVLGEGGVESNFSLSDAPETLGQNVDALKESGQTVANISDKAVAQQASGGAVAQQSAQIGNQADKFAGRFQGVIDNATANSGGLLSESSNAIVGSGKSSFWNSDFAKTAAMQLGGGLLSGLGQQMAQEDQQDEARSAEERGLRRVNAGIASAPSPVSVGLSGNRVNIRRYSNRYSG